MRPAFSIIVSSGGTEESDITSLIADRLLSLVVTDEAGLQSDRLTVSLDDRNQRIAYPAVGALLKVSLGYEGELVDKGSYTVDEVEVEGGPRTMTIRASAADFVGTIGAQKEKSWHDVTLGSIARSIASKHGLSPSIHPDMEGIQIGHADQTESDVSFLTRLAAENGGTLKVAGKKLVLTVRAPGKSVSGKTLPVIDVNQNDVGDGWSSISSSRGGYTGVRAFYHNTASGDRIPVLVGTDTKVMALPHTYANQGNAHRAAKAKLKAVKNGKGTLRISTMPGNPYIQADMRINAKGFRVGVDGEWIVIRAEHRLDASGYVTSVEAESPAGDK